MIDQEQLISYHNISLGAMTREGDTLAEISELDSEGAQQRRTLHVPTGLPGERVTIALSWNNCCAIQAASLAHLCSRRCHAIIHGTIATTCASP
jgi:hypothetical protein